MSCTRAWKQRISDAAIDGLAADQELASHLQSCPVCATEYDRASAFALAVKDAKPDKPTAGSLNAWNAIEARLESPRAGNAWARPRWDFAAAAGLALLLLGIGIGRWFNPTEIAPTSMAVAESPDRTTTEYVQFLETATPLLLAVANRHSGPSTVSFAGVDPAAEKELATRLADQSAQLSERLSQARRHREARLISSLQIVFLQLANLPEGRYDGGIELVQATIEERAILFQLTVEEMRRES